MVFLSVKDTDSLSSYCVVSNLQELQLEASAKAKFSVTSFSVKLADLPTSETDVPTKCHMLFERRLAREYLSKAKLCILTYYTCKDIAAEKQHQKWLLVQSMLRCLQMEAVRLLLAELQKGTGFDCGQGPAWWKLQCMSGKSSFVFDRGCLQL